MFGFKDVNEYYKSITLAGKFHLIKVPTFSLHTLDDFVCPAEVSPIKEA
jgi:predicted alpha/beta-fold hydrolase